MKINFATNSYRSQSRPVSAQRVVNLYAERQPPDAKTDVAVFACPGLELFVTCGSGPVRGMHLMGSLLYVVSGQRLYSVSSTGTVTDVGGNISGWDVVSMADNGSQLCIVNGTNGYIYSTTLGFVLISDTDFNAADTVSFLDQRFLFDWKGTNKFFSSGILDGTTYDALHFASAESSPDNVRAVVANKQILLVFGVNTTEPWQNVGAANFPWERVPGAVIDRGIAEPHAWAKSDNTIFFMGDDRVFYRLDGFKPTRISTFAIEHEWQAHTDVTGAFAFAYDWAGHKFVAVTFPATNTTWEYDIASGLWHERESWDENGRSLGRWRGNCHVSAFDYQLIGDRFSGKIGYLDHHEFAEFDCTMQAQAVSPALYAGGKRIWIPCLELMMETGVGATTGQGTDPQVMLEWSKDGGRTYGSMQKWRSMGAQGEYRTRLRWLKMGQSRDWVFRVTISDPVRRNILSAEAVGAYTS